MNRWKNYVCIVCGLAVLMVLGAFAAKPLLAQIRAALVKNVDERGRIPYQSEVFCRSTTAGEAGCNARGPEVPAGKRLVVEHVSTSIRITSGVGFTELFVSSGVSFGFGVTPASYLQPLYLSSGFGADRYVQSGAILQYFEAGDIPAIHVSATAKASLELVGLISGYLVDLSI